MINYTLVVSLACVMLANVIFGSSLAKIKKEFNKKTFFNGIYKAFTIVAGTFFMYLMAYLEPDMLVVSLNDMNLNMKTAIETIISTGIVMYGAMDLKKIAQLIGVSTSFGDVVDEPIVEVLEDNYIKR